MKLITMLCSLAVMSTLLCAQIQQAQGPGTVTGTVLNQDGQPIANANVCIAAVGAHSVSYCNSVTDQAGHFDIQHLAMGSFLVNAIKEEDGYAGFNRLSDPQNKVVLTLQEPTANVTIKLGLKAGTLVGTVKDSLTGKPVDKFQVMYTATDGKNTGSTGMFMGGAFRVNMPTTSDLIIFVSAPGYKTWFYVDPSTNSPSLHLASGEQKSVDIELVPDPKATKDAKQ